MIILIKKKEFVVVCVRYYIPDYTSILQDFIWETEDQIPDIPRVHTFLNYWKDNIEAKIKEVIVSSMSDKKYNKVDFYRVLN